MRVLSKKLLTACICNDLLSLFVSIWNANDIALSSIRVKQSN